MTTPLDPREIAFDLGIAADGLGDEELTAQLLSALVERNALFRKLARIQRSISHRAPLQEVLDAITTGAAELLGDEVVGLRLLDPSDPDYMVLRSVSGLSPEVSLTLERGPVGEGAGGRAIKENRLIIIQDYQTDPQRLPALAEAGLQAAMAAPVYEYGELTGSLVVASYVEGRNYTATEQEILLAFAEHASLALTDARTVERLREAQHAKDMFFAMASHELKTPLTVIMGTLRTIEKHHSILAGAVREEMLSAAYERGRELKDLIDRLLQGARAELAGLIRHVHFPELIERSIRGFDQTRLRVEPVPDAHVETDDLAVYEILGVFLENAIKHSPDRSQIDVVASIDGDVAKVCVLNDGTLPEDLAPEELFEAFRRGEGSESSGVGLGLYIAARLADAIKGRVDVRSEDGKISFGLHFPTHPVSTAEVPVKH